MSDTPLPPPPPPGASGPPTADPGPAPPTAAGSPVERPTRWRPLVAIAGSALGGALVAFLVSWALIGHDTDGSRRPIASDAPAAQSQLPGAGAGSSSGSGSSSAAPSRGAGQGASGAPSGSGSSSGTERGAMPSARSGAS
jgi:eukaryotic-like serine/threonine-protein kinase